MNAADIAGKLQIFVIKRTDQSIEVFDTITNLVIKKPTSHIVAWPYDDSVVLEQEETLCDAIARVYAWNTSVTQEKMEDILPLLSNWFIDKSTVNAKFDLEYVKQSLQNQFEVTDLKCQTEADKGLVKSLKNLLTNSSSNGSQYLAVIWSTSASRKGGGGKKEYIALKDVLFLSYCLRLYQWFKHLEDGTPLSFQEPTVKVSAPDHDHDSAIVRAMGGATPTIPAELESASFDTDTDTDSVSPEPVTEGTVTDKVEEVPSDLESAAFEADSVSSEPVAEDSVAKKVEEISPAPEPKPETPRLKPMPSVKNVQPETSSETGWGNILSDHQKRKRFWSTKNILRLLMVLALIGVAFTCYYNWSTIKSSLREVKKYTLSVFPEKEKKAQEPKKVVQSTKPGPVEGEKQESPKPDPLAFAPQVPPKKIEVVAPVTPVAQPASAASESSPKVHMKVEAPLPVKEVEEKGDKVEVPEKAMPVARSVVKPAVRPTAKTSYSSPVRRVQSGSACFVRDVNKVRFIVSCTSEVPVIRADGTFTCKPEGALLLTGEVVCSSDEACSHDLRQIAHPFKKVWAIFL